MASSAYPLRFSIEMAPNGGYVLVDWALGLVARPGEGRHEDAERLLAWVRGYLRQHGDVNIVQRSRSAKAKPRFKGGTRPTERADWRKEQRAIIRAYTRIAEIARVHCLPEDLMASHAAVLLAKQRADRLLTEALTSVGLA